MRLTEAPCDVVLAADVLYEPEFVLPLLQTLIAVMLQYPPYLTCR
jgi:hypothetical protein